MYLFETAVLNAQLADFARRCTHIVVEEHHHSVQIAHSIRRGCIPPKTLLPGTIETGISRPASNATDAFDRLSKAVRGPPRPCVLRNAERLSFLYSALVQTCMYTAGSRPSVTCPK